jgi:parvulin-like peptidyl-prolyl isomerase
MVQILQLGDSSIYAEDIVPLLKRFQLWVPFLKEAIIDQAIAEVNCSEEEEATALAQFCKTRQIASDEQLQAWLNQQRISPEQLEAQALRQFKLEKFKLEIWSNKLESYFLQRKAQFDRVIYSLIRTKDSGLAQELYFRIQDDERCFPDLARQYSQGPEAQTGGLIGPVELNTPHPNLARMLSISQPGQFWPPTPMGEWLVIVRLEQMFPAQFDEAMRQRLLNELFAQWLQEQLQTMPITTDCTLTSAP